MESGFIARAVYHDQPPFETMSATWSIYRWCDAKTELREVHKWAREAYTAMLIRVEIHPEG